MNPHCYRTIPGVSPIQHSKSNIQNYFCPRFLYIDGDIPKSSLKQER